MPAPLASYICMVGVPFSSTESWIRLTPPRSERITAVLTSRLGASKLTSLAWPSNLVARRTRSVAAPDDGHRLRADPHLLRLHERQDQDAQGGSARVQQIGERPLARHPIRLSFVAKTKDVYAAPVTSKSVLINTWCGPLVAKMWTAYEPSRSCSTRLTVPPGNLASAAASASSAVVPVIGVPLPGCQPCGNSPYTAVGMGPLAAPVAGAVRGPRPTACASGVACMLLDRCCSKPCGRWYRRQSRRR